MKKSVMTFALLIAGCMFGQNSNVGIGTATPDNSALLDLVSTNKAVMISKVSLNENNISDYSFLNSAPAVSLLVYNTNANFPGGVGMGYWDGTSWTHYFNDSNINLLLGMTKYYSRIYPSGVAINVNNADSGSLTPFFLGASLTSPWLQIPESTPFTITVDRPVNSVLITFTGMV